jgi:nitroreductase
MTTTATEENLASITRHIRDRRTIKPANMRPDPIPREHLDAILENANWAPTHGMTEPWRFTVFEGEARRELAEFFANLYKEITPPDAFRPDKFEKFSVNPTRAGAVIAIGMKRQEIEKIAELEEIEAVACAVQNMHLTASALGLAAFWSSPPVIYSDEMKTFLNLDKRDTSLGLFYIGYPAEGLDWPAGTRRPVSEKVSWRS